ncbi:MAG: TatD family hydrolase [Defluviitaleaceae bacterium]|nr:TatD family hydrolase [Defluviitaleaceae bacterium]
MYFDTHAHYDFDAYDSDRDEMLAALPAACVDNVINTGSSVMSSYRSLKLAHRYDYIYASAGVHPHYVSKMTDDDLATIRKLATDERCVAIGEIGFDYYYEHSTPEEQRKWFIAQLEIAKELDKPVIIHSRDATADTLQILRDFNITRGIVHCFSGDEQAATAYAKLGLHIGIGGVITFQKTQKTAKAIKAIGSSHIVLETDCPYLAPDPFRGKRNDSTLLKYICEKVSNILEISHEDTANITTYNSRKLFGLDI